MRRILPLLTKEIFDTCFGLLTLMRQCHQKCGSDMNTTQVKKLSLTKQRPASFRFQPLNYSSRIFKGISQKVKWRELTLTVCQTYCRWTLTLKIMSAISNIQHWVFLSDKKKFCRTEGLVFRYQTRHNIYI